MGGAESEIYDASTYVLDAQGIELKEEESIPQGKADARPTSTTNVLLEAANWNLINMRRTLQAQRERGDEITSEAGARFSRGVHPAQSVIGLRRAIELMRELGGGEIAEGIVDEYPRPAPTVTVDLPIADTERLLGISLSQTEVVEILTALEFKVEKVGKDAVRATVPDHRLDIGLAPDMPHQDINEAIARADLAEEIVRIYGYDRLPETMIADVIPPQHANPSLVGEEKLRDILTRAGLHEIITYRLTTPQREALLTPAGAKSDWPNGNYVTLANPISAERVVMRHTLLASELEIMRGNARWRDRQTLFEIGRVYLPSGEKLPDERTHLCITMTGQRDLAAWQAGRQPDDLMDYFDLKGVVDTLIDELHLEDVSFVPATHSSFHPGRTAALSAGGKTIGILGELHPLVREAFELPEQPILVADFDVEVLIELMGDRYEISPVSTFPAIYQDIAVIVDESTPAATLEGSIYESGGDLLVDVRLFDVYRGDQIGQGKKSLAYGLTFQSPDRTLQDKDADNQRERIVKALTEKFKAQLRA
jgi:phenylalanyl-tRNA synthetase beta chain